MPEFLIKLVICLHELSKGSNAPFLWAYLFSCVLTSVTFDYIEQQINSCYKKYLLAKLDFSQEPRE